jgi:hypothetical protein
MTNFNPAGGAIPHERVYAHQLSEGVRKGKYCIIERISTHPLILEHGTQTTPVVVPTLPTAAQDGLSTIYFREGLGEAVLEMFQTTAQTLVPSRHATKGILIGCDVVNNESVEFVPGGNHAANPLGCLAGTDPGVFIRATFEFADTSGTDQFVVGFRKQAAYAVPTSFLTTGDALYTDYFGIGFSGTAASNLVKTASDLNDAGSAVVTSTGFAWADGLIHTLEVRVKGRRVTCAINGVVLGSSVKKDGLGAAITAQSTLTTPVFSFDAGDFLIPFIFHRYDATTPGAVYLRKLVVGQLLEDGLDPSGKGPQ